jgi:hypothetical protein
LSLWKYHTADEAHRAEIHPESAQENRKGASLKLHTQWRQPKRQPFNACTLAGLLGFLARKRIFSSAQLGGEQSFETQKD